MSHDCVGRSFELSYGIGEIGEGHVTENVLRDDTNVWNTKEVWYVVLDWSKQSVTKINGGRFDV